MKSFASYDDDEERNKLFKRNLLDPLMLIQKWILLLKVESSSDSWNHLILQVIAPAMEPGLYQKQFILHAL